MNYNGKYIQFRNRSSSVIRHAISFQAKLVYMLNI